jgi:hypothetical protein
MKDFRRPAEFVVSVGAALCGRPVRPGRPRRGAPTESPLGSRGRHATPLQQLSAPLLLLAAFLLLTAQAPPSDLASRELRLEIKQAEDRVGSRVDGIQRRVEDRERKESFLLLLFGVSLVGVFPAYRLWVRKAKKLVDQKLGSLIESRPRALLALIDEREANLRRRHETPILVIAESLETEGLLRGSGFAKVTTRKPGEKGTESQIASGAIVVFNLEDGCSEETAADLITRNSLEYFLLYTLGRSSIRGKSATFANSPVTLFARLMELIEYKDALERESCRT